MDEVTSSVGIPVGLICVKINLVSISIFPPEVVILQFLYLTVCSYSGTSGFLGLAVVYQRSFVDFSFV